jgi:hypothetical protein
MREEISRIKTNEARLKKRAVLLGEMADSRYAFSGTLGSIQSYSELNASTWRNLHLFFLIRVWPSASKVIGLVSCVLSAVLIGVEVLGLLNAQIDEYFKEVISKRDSTLLNVLWISLFVYEIVCVHVAIFRFKFTGFYNLYWGQQTDATSLLYSGMYPRSKA